MKDELQISYSVAKNDVDSYARDIQKHKSNLEYAEKRFKESVQKMLEIENEALQLGIELT